MSLEGILNHIINEAQSRAEGIIRQANEEAKEIIENAKEKSYLISQEMLDSKKALYDKETRRLIVNARLLHKKAILRAKQELIDRIFNSLKSELNRENLKKHRVYIDKTEEVLEDIDFYIAKIRQDYESETARILFE